MKELQEYEGLLGPVATHVTSQPVGTWRHVKPFIHQEKCTLCQQCVQYCPTGVISVEGDMKLTINYEFCKGCGICSRLCAKNVISMVENE